MPIFMIIIDTNYSISIFIIAAIAHMARNIGTITTVHSMRGLISNSTPLRIHGK